MISWTLLKEKIIAHNASFDLGFINGELNLLNKEQINKTLVVDSLEIARSKFPGLSNSLDALCKRFNIDLSKRIKHNALLDCELLREVYINLLDAKEPKFNLSSTNQNEVINFKEKRVYNKKILKISQEEIDKHEKFLKSEIKKTFINVFVLYNFSKSIFSLILISLKPELSNIKTNIFLSSG